MREGGRVVWENVEKRKGLGERRKKERGGERERETSERKRYIKTGY